MKTNNITEVYEHLYKASDNLTGHTLEYIQGFQNAVYMLSVALKNYEHINLHLQNRKLKRQLLITDLNFDDSMFTIVELRKENNQFKRISNAQNDEIKSLKNKIEKLKDKKEAEIKKTVMGERINDVEIDFEGSILKFAINADKETFDNYFETACNYVYSRRDRKTKKVGSTIIRNWFMESYRDAGFKVVTV